MPRLHLRHFGPSHSLPHSVQFSLSVDVLQGLEKEATMFESCLTLTGFFPGSLSSDRLTDLLQFVPHRRENQTLVFALCWVSILSLTCCDW